MLKDDLFIMFLLGFVAGACVTVILINFLI